MCHRICTLQDRKTSAEAERPRTLHPPGLHGQNGALLTPDWTPPKDWPFELPSCIQPGTSATQPDHAARRGRQATAGCPARRGTSGHAGDRVGLHIGGSLAGGRSQSGDSQGRNGSEVRGPNPAGICCVCRRARSLSACRTATSPAVPRRTGATITPSGTICCAQATGIVSGEDTHTSSRSYGAADSPTGASGVDSLLQAFDVALVDQAAARDPGQGSRLTDLPAPGVDD